MTTGIDVVPRVGAPDVARRIAPPPPHALWVFGALLRRDVRVLRRELPYFLVRTVMQPMLFIVVFGALLPKMGFVRGGYTTALLPGVLARQPDAVGHPVGRAADGSGFRLDAGDRGPVVGADSDTPDCSREDRDRSRAGHHRRHRRAARLAPHHGTDPGPHAGACGYRGRRDIAGGGHVLYAGPAHGIGHQPDSKSA